MFRSTHNANLQYVDLHISVHVIIYIVVAHELLYVYGQSQYVYFNLWFQ